MLCIGQIVLPPSAPRRAPVAVFCFFSFFIYSQVLWANAIPVVAHLPFFSLLLLLILLIILIEVTENIYYYCF